MVGVAGSGLVTVAAGVTGMAAGPVPAAAGAMVTGRSRCDGDRRGGRRSGRRADRCRSGCAGRRGGGCGRRSGPRRFLQHAGITGQPARFGRAPHQCHLIDDLLRIERRNLLRAQAHDLRDETGQRPQLHIVAVGKGAQDGRPVGRLEVLGMEEQGFFVATELLPQGRIEAERDQRQINHPG